MGQCAALHHVTEWYQPLSTFDNSSLASRIDRVHSSLHVGHCLACHISCFTLECDAKLSDHKPLSFHMGTKPGRRQEFPSWVLENATFVEMLTENCESLGGESNCNSFEVLSEFKSMVRYCAKRVKRICNQSLATTTESKLAASIGLVRALQSSDVKHGEASVCNLPPCCQLGIAVHKCGTRQVEIAARSYCRALTRINCVQNQRAERTKEHAASAHVSTTQRWVASFLEAVAAWSLRVHSCNSGYVFGPHCL